MKGVYLVGGYPNLDIFEKNLATILDTSGITFVEIGLPFSEPVADGDIIASALYEVIDNDTSIHQIVEIVKKYEEKFEEKGIKKYFMTYANIIYSYGLKKFSDDFKNIIDGVIIPDLPNRLHDYFFSNGFSISIIPFITPESRKDDLDEVLDKKSDFIYYVSVRGITGSSKKGNYEEIKTKISQIKKTCDKKVIIGFGIKDKNGVNEALSIADGFVIGTAIVKLQKENNRLKEFLEEVF